MQKERLAHEDLNRKAERDLKEKQMAHNDINKKAERDFKEKQLYLTSISFLLAAVLLIFFSRDGGQNIDKILVEVRGFRTSLDKSLCFFKVYRITGLYDFILPKFVWIVRKLGWAM